MAGVQLRKCPLCLTAVAPGQLGFRDFSWLAGTLPGKVAPMDFDGVLERRGHLLVMELKPKGVVVGKGQLITYRTIVGFGGDVWLISGDPTDDTVSWARLDQHGAWRDRRSMDVDTLRAMVGEWWEAHA